MPIRLTDLVERVPAEVETRVKRVRDQTRPVLQEALRSETRLVMRTPAEAEENHPSAQVPVRVSPGYPAVLGNVEFPDDFECVLLIGRYRSALEKSRTGVEGLLELREELLHSEQGEQWIHATETELRTTARWATMLLELLDQHDPLKKVLAVEEDVLGIYKLSDVRGRLDDERTVNRAVIHIYWGVVGLVAEWMGCTVEDLAIVVLSHELAHAYTQLGADIEGRRWPASAFSEAESSLKEGLAQYYTHRVLHRLGGRYEGASNVFKEMLPKQPEPYRTHEMWVKVKDFSPEAVRRAMLEVRRWKEGKLADFNRRLTEAQKGLQPKKHASLFDV